jgi:hypothetical protein
MIASSAASLAADTQLLNLVMPDAQVLAGINITNAEVTPLGTFLLTQITANDKMLQELIGQTGFDPRKDLTEVLAASNGSTVAPASLALSRGNFDVAKISAAAKTGQVSAYNGATLIVSGANAVAFLGSAIAIAGPLDSVKAAVDRKGSANSISPALAAQVHTLSTTQDAWSVSLASLSALIPGASGTTGTPDGAAGMAGQALQFVKNIQSCSAGLKFGSTVQFTAQAVADTAQDAGALGDVIKMVASLAAMGAGQNKDAAAVAQLLQSLNIATDGVKVNLSAAIPEAQIEALLKTALAPSAKATKI